MLLLVHNLHIRSGSSWFLRKSHISKLIKLLGIDATPWI